MAVVLVSIFTHGLQAGDLGLYWDDAEQLMQGLQAADYRVLPYVFTDTAACLRSERPVAYLAFAITRLAFAWNVAAVHWTLVGAMALNAVLIGRLARSIVDDEWFAFAAGTTFALYPLAHLQVIWPATVHYHVACVFALLAMMAISKSRISWHAPGRLAWAAIAYGTSLLTHEGFALIPLVYAALHVLPSSRPLRERLAAPLVLGSVLVAFALWRSLLLPLYGETFYGPSGWTLNPVALVLKTLTGATAALFPWRAALAHVVRTTTAMWLGAALVVAAATWLLSLTVLSPRARTILACPTQHAWGVPLRAAGIGMALVLASVVAVTLSPIAIELVFNPSYGPRANFLALPGIALVVPAVIMLAARTAATAAALLARTPLATPARPPTEPNVVPAVSRFTPSVGLGAASAALALLALLGSLLHFDAKQGFVEDWRQHKTMLASLRGLAPRVRPDTVIVIANQRDRRAPYVSHYEVSSYMLATYDDWSVIGNTVSHLRFHRDGVESTYHRTPGRWFPRDVKGPIATHATQPVGRISYDRLLLFSADDGVLRAVPHLDVTTVDGERTRVTSNTDRVEPGPALLTPIWRHITR